MGGHGAVSLAVAGTANFLDFTTDGFVLYLFSSSHPALFQVGCFFLALSACVAWFFITQGEDFGIKVRACLLAPLNLHVLYLGYECNRDPEDWKLYELFSFCKLGETGLEALPL